MRNSPLAAALLGGSTTLLGLLHAAPAHAQEAGSLAAREATVPGGTLLIIAYVALWLLVFGYMAMIMRRQHALSRDLQNLERRMDEVLGQGD